jgi:hypothetical protein
MYRLRNSGWRGEEGIVMPVAAIVLFLIMALVGAVVLNAVTANTASNQQQWRNSALGAAEAGIQAADYRLTSYMQSNQRFVTTCFTTSPTSSGATSTSPCPSQSESFGAHGSFSYTVTPLNGTSAPTLASDCAGQSVVANLISSLTQYCITSTGTYDGVTRRVQERTVAQPPPFPVSGVLSLTGISINNGHINGNLTADAGNISLNNSTTATGTFTVVPPNTIGGGFTCGSGCTENTSGTAPTYAAISNTAYANAYLNNKDSLITTSGTQYYWGTGCATMPTTGTNAYDLTCSGTVGSSSSPVSLAAGNYFFCNFSASQTIWLKMVSKPVNIFIDSPARPGSPCAATNGPGSVTSASTTATSSSLFTGGANYVGRAITDNGGGIASGTTIVAENNSTHTVTLSQAAVATVGSGGAGDTFSINGAQTGQGAFVETNGLNINNPYTDSNGNPDASQLVFYSYGCPSCTSSNQPKVNITNGIQLNAEIYAPSSQFIYTNGTAPGIYGAVVAGSVTATNGLYFTGEGGGSKTGWVSSPTAWVQCPPTPSSSTDPNSGCY